MSGETTIRVNFGRPMPLFPLDSVKLMPHDVIQLHIFEERYRQMVSDALDGAGQIAMAVFEGDRWMQEYHGRPQVRPAVCVGHLAQHVKIPDGRYLIILQGVCRARIVQELPAEEGKLYREAMLEPVGLELTGGEEREGAELALEPYRHRLIELLDDKPLSDLRDAKRFVEHLRDADVPTSAIIEFMGVTLTRAPSDAETRYQLLAAADPLRRAQIVEHQLEGLGQLLRRAAPQLEMDCPKGAHWN